MRCVPLEPLEATRADLERVHPAAYLDRIQQICAGGGGRLDPDTYASSGTWRAATLAAGAGLTAVDAMRRGEGDAAFCAVRPPGHHANSTVSMGFCLISNVAVVAASLADQGERVLIVDYDAHHGNGTQDVFYDDPAGAVRQPAPVAAVPRHRPAHRGGRGCGHGLHGERAAARRGHGRCVPACARRAGRPAGARRSRPRGSSCRPASTLTGSTRSPSSASARATTSRSRAVCCSGRRPGVGWSCWKVDTTSTRSRGAAPVSSMCWPAAIPQPVDLAEADTDGGPGMAQVDVDLAVLARTSVIGDRFGPVLRELQPLTERFAAAGHRLFLVGGTVRDLLLAGWSDGRAQAAIDPSDVEFDIDATTTARPDEIKRCLQGWADAIWTQGERFGTIGATKRVTVDGAASSPRDDRPDLRDHDASGRGVQRSIAQARRRVLVRHRCRPVASRLHRQRDGDRADRGDSRRASPVLVDPFGGRRDLDDSVLRTPLGPEASFSDDPLRMLRAARFIARYGLQPEPSLLRAVRAMADRMQIVSAERDPRRARQVARRLTAGRGAALRDRNRPAAARGPRVGRGYRRSPTSRATRTCGITPWPSSTRCNALTPARSHSIGASCAWPRCCVRSRPARRAARLQSLRYSNDDTAAIVGLIDLAGPLLYRLANDDAPWTDADVRRHLRDAAGQRSNLHALVRAEAAVHAEPLSSRLRDGLDGARHRSIRVAGGSASRWTTSARSSMARR